MKSLADGRVKCLDEADRNSHTLNKSRYRETFSAVVDFSVVIVLQGALTMNLVPCTCSPFIIHPFVHIFGFLMNSGVDTLQA